MIDELLAEYAEGLLTREGLMSAILALDPIDTAIDALPEPWRSEFLRWARDRYDNDIPLDHFIDIIGGTFAPGYVAPPPDRGPIVRIRDWFRRNGR